MLRNIWVLIRGAHMLENGPIENGYLRAIKYQLYRWILWFSLHRPLDLDEILPCISSKLKFSQNFMQIFDLKNAKNAQKCNFSKNFLAWKKFCNFDSSTLTCTSRRVLTGMEEKIEKFVDFEKLWSKQMSSNFHYFFIEFHQNSINVHSFSSNFHANFIFLSWFSKISEIFG